MTSEFVGSWRLGAAKSFRQIKIGLGNALILGLEILVVADVVEPSTMRYSRDLDYFHDSEARVAEAFSASRPSEEIGCLYYSASQQEFVDPRVVADSKPHFGRPGGVLPRIVES